MTRIMRDSTNPNDIPVDGTQLAAGYANGAISQWPANSWDRFPNAQKVTIDVLGNTPSADVLDVEPGNASNMTAAYWVRSKLALNDDYLPIIYCSRSNLTPLFNTLNTAGYFINVHFKLWIATLDGTKSVPDMTGVTAVQYAGQTQTGGHYDESIVYDDQWKPTIVTPQLQGVLVELPNGTTHNMISTDGTTWTYQ